MNHSIQITNDSLKPNKNGCYSIKLRIKRKDKKQSIGTGVVVKVDDWDERYGHIKSKARNKYPETVVFIDAIYSRIDLVRVPLNSNSMSFATAFHILLGKNEKTGSILDFVGNFEPSANIQSSTINKHYQNIRAINSNLIKLGLTKYSPVEFPHLLDDTAIKNIATAIHTKFNLATNTIAAYIKSLNWVAKNAGLPRTSPFTDAGYLVAEIASGRNKPVKAQELLLGFNNIKTLQQLEAFCFWLYSLCLLGLDGKDIAGISEKDIATDGYILGSLNDFYPAADVFEKNPYTQPLHIHIKRGKTVRSGTDSGVDAIFMINLFPTLIVHRILKHLIDKNVNNYAYKGKDKLRLFNFDTKTEDGLKTWERVRKGYSDKMGKKLGSSTQRTRHTITNVAGSLGMSQEDVDRCLHHKIKGVNRHYWSPQQTINDVAHIHILQEYGILNIVQEMINFFKDKCEIVNGKEVTFIPKNVLTQEVQGVDVPLLHVQQIFDIGHLTRFSREDEVKYQTLLKNAKQGVVRNVDGVMTEVELSEEEYPEELKELIQKRRNAYAVEPKFKQELLDKIQIVDEFEDGYEEMFDKRKGKVVNLNTKTA
jgi:hypothetical protein